MREKLIELICDYALAIDDVICDGCGGRSIEGTVINLADHLIANGVTVQQWIPVTERLPEEWVDVLVWSKCGFCETAVYLGIPGKWRVTWNHDMLEVDSITHWMPLPTPPVREVSD